jgi:hypothetical protein
MLESDRERMFFEMYVSYCVYQSSHPVSSRERWKPNMKSLWETAALVPQVWVNWIHYDPKDRSNEPQSCGPEGQSLKSRRHVTCHYSDTAACREVGQVASAPAVSKGNY